MLVTHNPKVGVLFKVAHWHMQAPDIIGCPVLATNTGLVLNVLFSFR